MAAFIHPWPHLNSNLCTPEALQDELPVQTQHSKNLDEEWYKGFTQLLMKWEKM